MRIDFPLDIAKSINNALKSELAGERGSRSLAALNTLDLLPDLARDTGIQSLLIEMLYHPALGYRRAAAAILHRIGQPLGILHLTYNSLCVHPVIKQEQTDISGWNDIDILRNSDALTDECIALLIEDIQNPLGFRHGDVLAALPDERIVSKMLDLLDKPKPASARAAYALAKKNRPEGQVILEILAKQTKFIALAIIGLSHFPSQATIDILESTVEDNRFIKDSIKPMRERLRKEAALRLPLCRSNCQDTAIDVAKKTYTKNITKELDTQGVYLPDDFDATLFLLRPPDFVTPTPDFIAEFLTTESRGQCVMIQREGMQQIIGLGVGQYSTIHWPAFADRCYRFGRPSSLSGVYMDGIIGVYDRDDYLNAAVDWIIRAEEYRLGTLDSLFGCYV